MKHFIYLTEDKIYYIRKIKGRAKGYYFLGSRPVGGLEGVEEAVESLTEVYNLKGKKAILIMGTEARIHSVSLPASMKNTALKMAEKQLLVLGDEDEQLLAADLFQDRDRRMLQGVIYTVSGSWLRAVRSAAALSRLHLVSILPGPAVVASFPDTDQYGMGEGPVVLVQLSDDFIGLYEIENSRCLYWKKLDLKPGVFAKLEAERVLMEELQTQILRIQAIRKRDNEDFELKGVLMANECLYSPKSCARYLSELLELPCAVVGRGSLWEKQEKPEKLKNLQFSKSMEYPQDETLWMRMADMGFPVRSVFISVVLFAAVIVILLTAQFNTHRKLNRLELIYADRREVYEEEERKQLEDKLKELAGLTEEKRELSGTTVIDASLFSSLDLALKPGIELESLEFLANEGTIRIKLLTDDARNIPQFVQDMEEEGFFMEQSSWQKQEMKVHGEILLKPGKEEKHETQ